MDVDQQQHIDIKEEIKEEVEDPLADTAVFNEKQDDSVDVKVYEDMVDVKMEINS